jgi:threonine/homoserine efflux transporter RhtA
VTISEPRARDVERASVPPSMAVRAALLTIVVFFGGSLPAYKLASESFGPATTNLVRFVLATVMLLIIARHRLPTARRHVRRLLVIGMFGIGLMAVFMGIGVDRGSATIGSIVVGLEPIGVALAGVLLVGDAPSRRSLVALVVGFTGALVASGVFTEHSGPSPVLPIILLLGTVVAFSIYTAFVRRVGRGVDPLAVAAVTQVGALMFARRLGDAQGSQRGDLPRHRFGDRLLAVVPRALQPTVESCRSHDVPDTGVRGALLVDRGRRTPASARWRGWGIGAVGSMDQRASLIRVILYCP